MSDDCTALINANDWLEITLNERKRLLDLAPKLFKLLLEFCDDDQLDTDEWIVKTYWRIVKRRINGFAVDMTIAKQGAQDSSVAKEFEALKQGTTECLEDSSLDIREEWESMQKKIQIKDKSSVELGI